MKQMLMWFTIVSDLDSDLVGPFTAGDTSTFAHQTKRQQHQIFLTYPSHYFHHSYIIEQSLTSKQVLHVLD